MRDAAPLWSDWRADAELDVVGLGENSLDQICVVDDWPASGEKQALLHLDARPGGQVASAMLGCARLGLRVGYLGAVGRDASAATVLAPLEHAGIDLSGVRHVAGARTRTAVVLVRERDGERTILAYRDPRLHGTPEQSEARQIERARVLHLDASDPDLALWAARTARTAGIPVVLDVDSVSPQTDRLLGVIDFPVVARRFAEEYGGTGAPADGLAKLASGGARLAVVTCGAEGALARSGERTFHSPAFAVDVRDTTGAGDAFHTGFIWGLLQGHPPERVLHVANAVAAMVCTRLGAQEGLPRRDELLAWLADEPERERERERDEATGSGGDG